MQYYIGCSGWSYTSREGPFYPSGTENFRWLNYYSHVFDYVEIDSSFYRIPNNTEQTDGQKLVHENTQEFQIHGQVSEGDNA